MKHIEIVNPELCKHCSRCIQACFTKAIKIDNNKIIRNTEKCLNCGFCTNACNMNIHRYKDDSKEINELLQSDKKVFMILDRAFSVDFYGVNFDVMEKELKKIGFFGVEDNSLGGAIYNYLNLEYSKKHNNTTIIEGFCTSFVNYIRKFYPKLVARILPYDTPDNINAKLVREKYGEDIIIVYASSCLSSENKEDNKNNPIDYIISMKELKEIFKIHNIDISKIKQSRKNKHILYDFSFDKRYRLIDSPEDCTSFLKFMNENEDGELNRVIVPYWCSSTCFNSYSLDKTFNSFKRESLFQKYKEKCIIKYIKEEDIKKFGNLERFKRTWIASPIETHTVKEEDIQNVLIKMGKYSKANEFDCGACGYSTCRENAIAVILGMIPFGQCIPYISKENERYAERTMKIYQELDDAFALTIPNSRLEHKLKNTPEFKDEFLPGDTPSENRIRILEVISDGGYRHVVNALKVAADLKNKGVMNLIGIEKDVLVKTIIFHDMGKAQPTLFEGNVVSPTETFEDGKEHALRSAEFALNFYKAYGITNEIYYLIKYHHHSEEELPSEFPQYLLPMYRLFRIIDGMSAGLTRRGSAVNFELYGSELYIKEHSKHPKYKKFYSLDLYKPESKQKEYDYNLTVEDILKKPIQ